jgi:probable HAF family extracellular repeat protein
MVLLAPVASAQQFSYTITDLGPASVPGLAGATWMGTIYTGGTYTLGINAAGNVVGASPSASGNVHAALFRNGQVIDLGTLGGLTSEASAINKAGLIVGNSQIASGSVHAFLFSNNLMTDLGTLGGINSFATAINDAGQIVGRSDMSDGTSHAFLYAAGVMTDLGPGVATSINTAGQIVINSSGFISVYANGAMQALPELSCPSGESQSGAAYSINDSGEVVGDTVCSNGWPLWSDRAMSVAGQQATDIEPGTVYSAALAINASGHILGQGISYCDGGACESDYTSLDGALIPLGYLTPVGSGWEWMSGAAINDAGQIAGFGINANGFRAFLMTPIALPTVSITSPASGAIVGGVTPVYASATDATGVAGVQFKLDGANLGPEVIAAPYVTLWNTTFSAGGTHVLSAVARDGSGVTGTAAPVNVTVDNVPLSVSITAPASGATVSGTITVSATATGDVRVVGVQFKLDGANLGSKVTTAPYAVSWNTASAPNALHTLTAVARDVAGNTSTSSAVTVRVRNHP